MIFKIRMNQKSTNYSKNSSNNVARRGVLARSVIVAALALLVLVSIPSMSFAEEHDLGVFAGLKFAGSTSSVTYGLDYEYHFMPFFGITGFFEKVSNSASETDFGIGLAVHPIPLFGLKLMAGPGMTQTPGQSTMMFRTGIAYEISLGPIFGGPSYTLDVANGSSTSTLGVVAGLEF